MMPATLWLLGWYGAASLSLFALYGLDKSAARRGRRRVPENSLHMLALLGGWPGALAGQWAFRHKTRKQPFRAIFVVTIVLNCTAIVGALVAVQQGWEM